LEGQEGTNAANKERGRREDGKVGHVTSQKPARYPIEYSRIDVIT